MLLELLELVSVVAYDADEDTLERFLDSAAEEEEHAVLLASADGLSILV